ncbi:MAG: hypothetical protein RBS32_05135 [Aliarcobacter sp.]|jgi:hypothetical protein|nr:hypothetical protein [Aliarcobacter sp.]
MEYFLFKKLNLYTPTHFTLINNKYFIVDCWNDRILIKEKGFFKKWKVISSFNKPHRIRFFNNNYFICDTDNNQVLRYDINLNNNEKLNLIDLERPHDIQIYDNLLFIIDCYKGSSRLIKYNLDTFHSEIIFQINNLYARSFKIINHYVYISCSSSGEIIELNMKNNFSSKVYCENKDNLSLACLHHNEQLIYGIERFIPNDIDYYDGYFYMTNYFYKNSKNKFIRFKTLIELDKNNFEDLSYLTKGVPYYIEIVGDDMYLGEIDDYSNVKILNSKNNMIKIKKVLNK